MSFVSAITLWVDERFYFLVLFSSNNISYPCLPRNQLWIPVCMDVHFISAGVARGVGGKPVVLQVN